MARTDGLTHGLYGAKPPKPIEGLANLDEFVLAPFPALPSVIELPKVAYGMDGNDVWGNCVVVGAAHLIAIWNAVLAKIGLTVDDLVVPDESACVSVYQHLTGARTPGDANDTGLVVSDVLSLWYQTGLFPGLPKLGPFAPISLSTPHMLRQAIAAYGAVGISLNCPTSAEDEFDADEPWTYVEGSPIAGGHFVVAGGYHSIWIDGVSWGAAIQMGPEFLAHYAVEYWCPVGAEFVTAGRGPEVDEAAMVAALPSLDH
jgi:hypothetical protein